jgi:trk system potassium uptake protein
VRIPRARPRPALLVLLAFVTAILVGAALLLLPIARAPGVHLTPLDALFMASSAVCVTGLIVVEPGLALSRFGQGVILLLIKIGGLGVLTVGALIAFTTGARLGILARLGLQTQTNVLQVGGVVRFVRALLLWTTTAELVGAALLWPAFARTLGGGEGAWWALFHAVSAWNNAGFALAPESVAPFTATPSIPIVIAALFAAGGLGLLVIVDVATPLRRLATRGGAERSRWSLHTRLALASSGALALVGIVGLAALEWSNPATLGAVPAPQRPLLALFQGLTPRTAGFAVVPVAELTPAGQLLTTLLMIVGGNPSSTAGGIKTTTFAVLLLAAWAAARGRNAAVAFGRTLPDAVVRRAAAILTLAAATLSLALLALTLSDPGQPLPALAFEAVSAFGTVGLSFGITAELSAAGQGVLILLMLIGRVGLLTFALALVAAREQPLRYPREEVIVG